MWNQRWLAVVWLSSACATHLLCHHKILSKIKTRDANWFFAESEIDKIQASIFCYSLEKYVTKEKKMIVLWNCQMQKFLAGSAPK